MGCLSVILSNTDVTSSTNLFVGSSSSLKMSVSVSEVAQYFQEVIKAGHPYCCKTLVRWFNSDVGSSPQLKKSLPFSGGKIIAWTIFFTTVECTYDESRPLRP